MSSEQTLRAIKYDAETGTLELLNQILLPQRFVYERVASSEECFDQVRSMKVRGAPAIAVAAALSIAVDCRSVLGKLAAASDAVQYVSAKADHIEKSRPTAVNLHNACVELKAAAAAVASAQGATADAVLARVMGDAYEMLRKDESDNRRLSEAGAEHIAKLWASQGNAAPAGCVMTHCNAGALATVEHGTALGVARFLRKRGVLARVYCTETRPWLQGARLSSFEMAYEHIPVTLIVDGAVSALLRSGRVDAIVVGADRICRNGDVANKIGTYHAAVSAARHGVPFFVAAPVTTVDLHCERGEDVVIEERPASEITCLPWSETRIVAEGVDVWNPSFDVTPAELIAGIITEHGVITKRPGEKTFDVAAFVAQHTAK
eukprot:m51a1_g2989 putative methylthioribose-1-phosphate isomerase (377) ;mRNA; r:743331-744787